MQGFFVALPLHLSEEGAENGTPATILFPSIP